MFEAMFGSIAACVRTRNQNDRRGSRIEMCTENFIWVVQQFEVLLKTHGKIITSAVVVGGSAIQKLAQDPWSCPRPYAELQAELVVLGGAAVEGFAQDTNVSLWTFLLDGEQHPPWSGPVAYPIEDDSSFAKRTEGF